MEQVYIQIDGKLELVGELDNSCEWGTFWRFLSRRNGMLYMLGYDLSRDDAKEYAVLIDLAIQRCAN